MRDYENRARVRLGRIAAVRQCASRRGNQIQLRDTRIVTSVDRTINTKESYEWNAQAPGACDRQDKFRIETYALIAV